MKAQDPSIKICFENLVAVKNESNKRLPLTLLDNNCHIHGGLRIQIQNRYVPHLGFSGPDDACFSVWIEELDGVIKALQDKENSFYVFDEGEQGQPAFLFEKHGETVYLSIVDAEFSGGKADPAWQKIPFAYEDFLDQYKEFKTRFFDELRALSPHNADSWTAAFIRRLT